MYPDISRIFKLPQNRKRIGQKAVLATSRTFLIVTSPLKRYTRPGAYTGVHKHCRGHRPSMPVGSPFALLSFALLCFALLCLALPCFALPCFVSKKSESILSPLSASTFSSLIIVDKDCLCCLCISSQK